LLDHKAQLGGVVKSVVDFLLRVFGVHATPTLGRGVTVVNTRLENASTEFRRDRYRAGLDGVAVVLWRSGWD
jgi:hypothetical protein